MKILVMMILVMTLFDDLLYFWEMFKSFLPGGDAPHVFLTYTFVISGAINIVLVLMTMGGLI